MKRVSFYIVAWVAVVCLGIARAASIDPRAVATSSRAVKLQNDFRAALANVAPKLGIDEDSLSNILDNLSSMVPREGLLNPWRESNTVMQRLPSSVGGVSKNEFPSMLEVREGILIIQKAKAGENISLTAFYGADITDPETESETVKKSKDLVRNSKWAYRFVFSSRLKVGHNNDVSTLAPIFLLRYIDEIPKNIRVLNDAKVYIMGNCRVDQDLEIITRDNGVFGADNLNVNGLSVDQRDNSSVYLNGGRADVLDAVADKTTTLQAGQFKADSIQMNLSRDSCREVVVNPQKELVTIGKLKRGTFTSVNPQVTAEDGSVFMQNMENMGNRIKKLVTRSSKAIVFGPGYVSWKIVEVTSRVVGAVLKRLANARVGVGTSMKVGPLNLGVGALI